MDNDDYEPRERMTVLELAPATMDRILAVIAVGASQKDAAIQAGICERTLANYRERGRQAAAKPESERTDREEFWAEFWWAYEQASTQPKVYILGLLQQAAKGDWKAGAWLLEKLWPKEFGSRMQLEAHVQSTSVHFDLSKLTTEELLQLKALREKMGLLTEGDDE